MLRAVAAHQLGVAPGVVVWGWRTRRRRRGRPGGTAGARCVGEPDRGRVPARRDDLARRGGPGGQPAGGRAPGEAAAGPGAVARRARRWRLCPGVLKMLRWHRPLVLNCFGTGRSDSSGVVEGMNLKAKLAMRKACTGSDPTGPANSLHTIHLGAYQSTVSRTNLAEELTTGSATPNAMQRPDPILSGSSPCPKQIPRGIERQARTGFRCSGAAASGRQPLDSPSALRLRA